MRKDDCQGLVEGENRSYCLMGVEFQFYRAKELWTWVVKESCTMMNVFHTTELYNLKIIKMVMFIQ